MSIIHAVLPKRALYAFTAVLALVAICKPEDITVRVISAKTGRPIVEQHVQLAISRLPNSPGRGSAYLFNGWAYTDNHGAAVFRVNFPIPVGVHLLVAGIIDMCSPGAYEPDDVLHEGASIADSGSCPHRPLKRFVIQPHPGEIVIYSAEYTRWERARYFPWHG